MKNISLKTAGLVTALFFLAGIMTANMAQQGHMRFRGGAAEGLTGRGEMLKLTDDQKKQMPELKAKFQEESTKINNLIREKQAHIKTLIDTENRDPKELNKTIDELSTLRGDLIKKAIEHRDAVKKILTPEQMRIWDRAAHHRMQGMRGMRGMQPGMHQGMRAGMGRGMGQAISVQGYPINVEHKEIVVEGKPMKVVEKEIVIDGKKMKTKKKSGERKIEKEDQ